MTWTTWPQGHASESPAVAVAMGDDDDRRRAYRSGRFATLAVLRRASGLKSVRSCMSPLPETAPTARVGISGIARMAGIGRCGSPWSCPVCGPTVRRRRALEVDAALSVHRSLVPTEGDEAAALFVTVTMRHSRKQPLSHLLDGLLNGWRLHQQTTSWRRTAARYHLSGTIKAVEINRGSAGWHPHLHLVLFFDKPMSALDQTEFRSWLSKSWSCRMYKAGFGTTHKIHGVDVRRVAAPNGPDGASLGRYMLDVVEGDGSGWGVGSELVRGDLKRGRHDQRSAHELMQLAVDGGESWAWYDWWEYEKATKGRRMCVWSRGLRARLGLGEEVTDEEAAVGDVGDSADEDALEVIFDPRVWVRHLFAGTAGEELARIERGALLVRALAAWAHPAP